MAAGRVGGLIFVQVNGAQYQAKGNFTWNLGSPKREAVMGSSAVAGYTEKPQVPFIEGEFTDDGTIDVRALTTMTDGTVVLQAGNGKTVVLSGAWYAAEGTVNTEEGNMGARFEGMKAEEVPQ